MGRIFLVCFYLLGSASCLIQGVFEFYQHIRYTKMAKRKGKKFGKIFVLIGVIFVCLCFGGVAFSLSYLVAMDFLGCFGYSFILLAIILSTISIEASKHYVVHKPGDEEENE